MKVGTAGFITADEVGLNYDLSGIGSGEMAGSGAFRGTAAADVFAGGADRHVVDYIWTKSAVVVDLAAGKASGGGGDDRLTGIDSVIGSPHADRLTGDARANVLLGNAGNDDLKGAAGSDHLTGGAGNDTLDGGGGADKMLGGAGNDTFFVDSAGDRVEEHAGEGEDTIITSVSWTLSPNVENLTFTGAAAVTGRGSEAANTIRGGSGSDALHGMGGNDSLVGGSGNDHLYGGNGNDSHEGGSGTDILKGGAGSDVLNGGAGMDRLYGGDGADIFEFTSPGDSAPGQGRRDSIQDFARGVDRIDLRDVDASTKAAGNQAFTFIGKSAFAGAAGQLRWTEGKGYLVVQADVNGDRVADFEIQIAGATPIDKSAFML
jgi:Ca2+-binding RTX toxin-like protein